MRARRLWIRLGRDGITSVRDFVEGCERHGDEAAARFWAEVASELEAIAEREGVSCAMQTSLGGPGTWRLMQRIERYRHRAMEAARAAGPEALRAQTVLIATHWLELAREAEALAMEAAARKAAVRRGGLRK